MRYEDWDLLIFPQDSKIPLQEFKTQCHVVHDPEFAFTSGSYGLPTLTCFVPGLTGGTPFNISLHNWRKPEISQYTRSYSQHLDIVKWEARVIIDGRLVASSSFTQGVTWPQLLSRSFEFTKNGELLPLKFPHFREELLQQNYWSPSDELGRIKIILSEGFPRDSLTVPVERVKNLITFSFQHAPMDILESSGIAWPNPRMWYRSPIQNQSMPVPTQAHTGAQKLISTPHDVAVNTEFASQYLRLMTLAWLGAGQKASRKARKLTSSDLSMPDYISNPGSISQHMAELQQTGSHAHNSIGNIVNGDVENAFHHPKASSRTANSLPGQSLVEDLIAGASNKCTPGRTSSTNDLFVNSTKTCGFPSELATSLTQSLLSQPSPLPAQAGTTMTAPAAEVKSRKENRLGVNRPALLDHLDMRKVSQAAFGDSSENFTQNQNFENGENSSREASSGVSPQASSRTFSGVFSHCSGSGGDLAKKLNSTNNFDNANLDVSTPARMDDIGDVHLSGSGRGAKRSRHQTPTGPNVDQNEPRSTPHVRVGFGETMTN
ncbi:hypothetical protein PG990_005099 [Apiospora arundinis]